MFDIFSLPFTSKHDFISRLAPDSSDEAARATAARMWRAMENNNVWYAIAVVLIPAVIAALYYFWIANRPGRKYRWRWAGPAMIVAVTVVVGVQCCVFLPKGMSSVATGYAIQSLLWTALYAVIAYLAWATCFSRTRISCAYPLF